jgi:predicted nuclease of predicted toxin-antitoxin system
MLLHFLTYQSFLILIKLNSDATKTDSYFRIIGTLKEINFTIVTKNADVAKLALLRKTPPKVIYLKTFNSNTNQISGLLIKSIEKIHNFSISNQDAILEI